jgi:hypothetical protein
VLASSFVSLVRGITDATVSDSIRKGIGQVWSRSLIRQEPDSNERVVAGSRVKIDVLQPGHVKRSVYIVQQRAGVIRPGIGPVSALREEGRHKLKVAMHGSIERRMVSRVVEVASYHKLLPEAPAQKLCNVCS